MDAQAVRRRLALLCVVACSAGNAAAQDTTFLDGPALAERLLHNVVRLHADEHGYGLAVGADATHVFVVTARHVVGARNQVALHWCAAGVAQPESAAELVAAFDAEDLALLRVARPAGFSEPLARALAPPERVALRDPSWLLGRNDECSVIPRAGAVAMLPDERGQMRVDLPGVLGGSSGAPVATGRGIVGIATDSDNVSLTLLAIARIEQRVRAQPGLRWGLVDARNIPPTEPQAAEIDLAETLNQYLFNLRNVHALLQQRVVARATFEKDVRAYNASVDRFRDARDKYDGTLRRDWPPEVAPMWSTLREQLWAIHLNFWRVNPHAREIFESERTPAVVREQMKALEPELAALESAIAQFLRTLGQRR